MHLESSLELSLVKSHQHTPFIYFPLVGQRECVKKKTWNRRN